MRGHIHCYIFIMVILGWFGVSYFSLKFEKSGNPQGQSDFQSNTKTLFAFFTVLLSVETVQKFSGKTVGALG